MEANIAKESDRVVLNQKRKRATRCAAYLGEASHEVLSHCPFITLPMKKLVKQRRLDGYKNKMTSNETHFRQTLLRCYLNFKKSGRPERLLFYQNNEWNDYPQDIVDLVGKDFEVKNAAIEIEFDDRRIVLDFLHMYQMDLKTGLQKPIAWIDEAGCCFFPEVHATSDDEPYEGGKIYDSCESNESYESNEIKLHLEIEINGVGESNVRECSGESNALVKHIHIDAKPASNQYDVDIEDSSNNADNGNVGESVEKNLELGLDNYTKSVNGKMDINTVQELFLEGMSSHGSTDVVDIYSCSSTLLPARLELFQKQVEITEKCRGSANVQYAWLASSKAELSTILKYGFRHSMYGIGVHLAAANCPFSRANYCDVDENGVRHMVLCRVILGNMELLCPGSTQLHPSSNDYDSGVDDIESPKCFTVWTMNMNTHVYPEFIVSFTVSSDFKGNGTSSFGCWVVGCLLLKRCLSLQLGVQRYRLLHLQSSCFVLRISSKDCTTGSPTLDLLLQANVLKLRASLIYLGLLLLLLLFKVVKAMYIRSLLQLIWGRLQVHLLARQELQSPLGCHSLCFLLLFLTRSLPRIWSSSMYIMNNSGQRR